MNIEKSLEADLMAKFETIKRFVDRIGSGRHNDIKDVYEVYGSVSYALGSMETLLILQLQDGSDVTDSKIAISKLKTLRSSIESSLNITETR